MADYVTLDIVLPDMLSMQLQAADVYTQFYKHANDLEESELWLSMLMGEISHIRFITMLLEEKNIPTVRLPSLKSEAFRLLNEKAHEIANDSPFDRTLWALRLEHAQIDFGVEALAVNKLIEHPETPVLPGNIQDHYRALLRWATRYKGAREVATQMARIEEHFPEPITPPAS